MTVMTVMRVIRDMIKIHVDHDSHNQKLNSLYSHINIDTYEKKYNQENYEEKIISDIISFYNSEPQPEILELIELPISPENLLKLKKQWNREFQLIEYPKKEKNIWRKIKNLIYKKQKN